jgi:hypothetical protein
VIAYATGTVELEGGTTVVTSGAIERFVGVYSGRINEQSDLGIVWKARGLAEILDGQQRGPVPVLGALP